MIRISQIAGNSAIYVGFEALNKSIPVILVFFLSHFLSPSEVGLMAQFTALVILFTAFVGMSTNGAIAVQYYRGLREDIGSYVFNTFLILAVSTTIALVLVPLVGETISNLTGLAESWIYLAIITSCGLFIVVTNLTLWQAQKKPVKYGAFQFINLAFYFLTATAAVLLLDLSWVGAALSFSFAHILFGIFSVISIFSRTQPTFAINRDYLADALRFGVPLMPHAVSNWFFAGFNIVLAGTILGQEQAGIMAVAIQFFLIISAVSLAINRAYSPIVFEQLETIDDPTRRQLVRLTYLGFLLMLLLGAFVWGVGILVVVWLVDENFKAASGLIGYFAIAGSFNAAYYFVAVYLFYEKKTAVLSAITVGTAALHIGIAIGLAERFGLAGIAISLMIVSAARFIAVWIASSIFYPMPWHTSIKSS